ncbi:transposable element Tcb2 transposase [Trichonephila clavipes]|nr:transposable element Tcb2 transposase [Trichonephila clavipes]
MDPTCQQRTIQAGGGSVMVWGLCSWHDMGPLQDNATPPRPESLQSGSMRTLLNVHTLPLAPPKSSDINIIEHISDVLQHAVQKLSPPPLTPTDLWTALQDSWCQLPLALLQTLIESMPRRVEEGLRARGGPTRY